MNNSAVEKTQRKQVQRDRAAIRAEVKTLNSPQSTQAQQDRAVTTISATVLRGTGLSATGDSGQMLGRLAVELLNNPGTVIALGVEDTIKLKATAEEAASIPAKVVERLKKLVK